VWVSIMYAGESINTVRNHNISHLIALALGALMIGPLLFGMTHYAQFIYLFIHPSIASRGKQGGNKYRCIKQIEKREIS